MTYGKFVAIAGAAVLAATLVIVGLGNTTNHNNIFNVNDSLSSLRSSNSNEHTQARRKLAAATLADFNDPKSLVAKTPFVTSAKKCSSSYIEPRLFTSQSKEDQKLMKWFGNLCEGTYIEMGALDGKTFSNSFVFNRARQWQGVLVELMTRNYELLIQNRPNEIATIHAGVCDAPTKLHYFDGIKGARNSEGPNPVGGIYEFASESFIQRWWKGVPLDHPDVQEIQCDTLDNLLLQHAPQTTFFDFYSLDVEGAELSVLNSIDFNRVGFGVVLVEADGHNEFKNLAMRQLLESNGYLFLEEWHRSYWFVNRHFHEIYRDVIY